jgi:Uncharacterised protein family (UPF0236)
MATAAVLSFEETRQGSATTRAREQLHAYLDRWMDSVEATMPEDAPSLEELTQAVFTRRQELTGKIIETLVAQRHAQGLHQRTLPCSHCQRFLPARPAPPRTVHTMVGEVSLSRPYFYCPQCQQGFAPLDDALQLSERRTQWDLQQAAARLAAEVPFATAQELFTQLTGLSLSNHTIHAVAGELTQELGVLDVSPPAAEVARRVAEMAAGKTWRPVMVLALDGAFVPTRPEQAKGEATGRRRTRAQRAGWQGEWREAKGFRFYLVDKERIVHLLSWYQVASDADMGTALQCVKAAGLIPEDQVRLCVIGDGAKWIWNQVHALFPTAVQILDYYHCSAHMHTVGHLQFSEDAVQEQEWVEAMMARLFWGYVDWTIEGLAALQPRDHQAAEEIRKLIGFLQNNAGRLHYRTARKGGYPIGSGGIEAANKSISHVRLKRSGAWWYLAQANHMLALRCAIYNGTFEHIFEAYKRRALQKHGRNPP